MFVCRHSATSAKDPQKSHNSIGDVYLTVAAEVLKTQIDFPTAREKMSEIG